MSSQPSAAPSTPHPRNTLNELSGEAWLYFTKSVELVGGDHRYLPSFPAPHSDLKAVLRVADVPCSCVVSYPEYPSFRAHVRLVLAADRHLRVYQFIDVHERAKVQPQKSSAVCRGYLYYQEGW